MDSRHHQSHPYLPRELKLPDYVPVHLSQLTIVGVYGVSSLVVVSLVWIISGRWARVVRIERLLMCWWTFTGLTHLIIEGYFVFSPEFYKDKTACYLAEIWKEYSKGDSRYAARDAAVVAVEGLTCVLAGPASLLAVYAIATKKKYRYIIQFAISLAQLYGLALYFVTSYLEGDNFATDLYYYYTYYLAANAPWIVVPLLITYRCWNKICSKFKVRDQHHKDKRH